MGLSADLDNLENEINKMEAKLGQAQTEVVKIKNEILDFFNGGSWGGHAGSHAANALFPGKVERLEALIDRLVELLGDYRSIAATISDVIQVIGAIVGFFSDAWDWAAGAVSDLADGVADVVSDIGDAVGDFFGL